MAVSKADLCRQICEMVGHTRKNSKLNGFTKRELLVIFAHMSLNEGQGEPVKAQKAKK